MRLIDQMSKHDIKELIGKCWITHDGMWFAHTLFEQGIESANRINKAAIKALASIEIKRFQQALNLSGDQLKSFDQFRDFFLNVSDLIIPEFMNVEFSFPGRNTIEWRFNERGCFAYNGVKMLNVADEYECGVLYRIKCWLDVLGFEYEMEPNVKLCIMQQAGECSGRFKIKTDVSDAI